MGATSVALGAFGAHGLEDLIEPARIENYLTGVRYQFYHSLGLLALSALLHSKSLNRASLNAAAWLWISGTLLFSGSLYLISLEEFHGLPLGLLGPVTPVGGILLICGWVAVFISARKSS